MADTALIIGGDSTIGKALNDRLRAQGMIVHTTSRRDSAPLKLDIAHDPARWPAFPAAGVAFLCAAVTGMDSCENDPVASALINVTHMQALAARLFAHSTYVVFLSSNQVFDGTKPHRRAEEPVCPISAYGRQKAAFETWLLAQPHAASVLRITKAISGKFPVLATWENALMEGNSIEAFTDLRFAPLPLDNVTEALGHLADKKPQGIFQLSGPQDISYYDVALALAGKLGLPPARVTAISARTKGILPQFLPAHTTLTPSGLFAGIPCPTPLEALGITP